MRDIIKLSVVLFIITAIAAVVLGFTNSITKDTIAEQIEMENLIARQSVMPLAGEFEQVDQDLVVQLAEELGFEDTNIVSEVFAGKKGEAIVGYTLKSLPKGFGGEMSVLTGITIDGEITGMKVISHNETPGLGANATNVGFQERYKGKSSDNMLVVVKTEASADNEIQAITGATITTDAVTNGVNYSIEIFKALNK